MEYIYEVSLDDLKNLDHIEWFVLHSNEYTFYSEKALYLLGELKKHIYKKNIYYYIILKDYQKLVELINNDPYNYRYDVLDEAERKEGETSHLFHYFIDVEDNEGRTYTVPYQYLLNSPTGHDMVKAKGDFNDLLYRSRDRVAENLQVIHQQYDGYYKSGVEKALENYEAMGNGRAYKNGRRMVLLFIYNVLLYKVVKELMFFPALTHFWQFFSDEGSNLMQYMYGNHTILAVIAFLGTAFFIWMDIVYIRGMIYSIYTKQKYNELYKHHQGVLKYYVQFREDYMEVFGNRPLEAQIAKSGKRNSVYIPLIRETSVRFDFRQKQKNGEVAFHSPTVRNPLFYSQPIGASIFALIILCVLVEAICNYPIIGVY